MTASASATTNAPARGTGSAQPALERCVSLLARAVQRVRAYPQGSPLATQALEAAHRALASLDRDSLVLRVSRRVLLVDDVALPMLPATADFAARLHHASIASVAIARDLSARDLTVFCRELVGRDHLDPASEPLPDALRQRGVEKIAVTRFERPSVLDVAVAPARLHATRERSRTAQEPGATAGYLYPPGKGWVRLDPGGPAPDRFSLADLACAVADPFVLAGMLVSLSDDPPAESPADALERTFEDVAVLFRSADPAIAEDLLAGLARALLALDPERRQRLLRDSILPGLIEGRLDGSVLRHLPDLDLADSLAVLLDLQLAAPELLILALDRLEMSDERRRRLEPLLRQRLEAHDAERSSARGAEDGEEEGQIRVDLSSGKEFGDFRSFDLAMDADADEALARARDVIAATDLRQARLGCLVALVQLEANPDAVAQRLATVLALLGELRAAGQWEPLAAWVERLAGLQHALALDRTEIAERISTTLEAVVDEGWVAEVARLGERPATAPTAARLVAAGGSAIVAPLVRVLEHTPRNPGLVRAVSAHARTLAPALAAHLDHPSADVVRDLVAMIGPAGPGAEPLIASALAHRDERVVREACKALVQIGSLVGLGLVSGRIATKTAHRRLLFEAYWRFPAALAGAETRRLLSDQAFVSAHPGAARQLVRQAVAHRIDNLGPVLQQLAALRTHVWRPSHAWLGLTAARAARRS